MERDWTLDRVCTSCADRPPQFVVADVGPLCQQCLANSGDLTLEQLETAVDFDPGDDILA